MLEKRLLVTRRSDQRNRLGLMRKNGGSEGHPLIGAGMRLCKLMRDRPLNRIWQVGFFHHLLDKITVASLSRDAPRRRPEVTHFCECAHFVAYRRRANIQTVVFDQRL